MEIKTKAKVTRAPPPPPILPPSKILLPLPSPPSRRKKDFHCGANSRFHPRTTLVTREVRGHGGREHTIHSQHERYKPIPPILLLPRFRPSLSNPTSPSPSPSPSPRVGFLFALPCHASSPVASNSPPTPLSLPIHPREPGSG